MLPGARIGRILMIIVAVLVAIGLVLSSVAAPVVPS
jgi:hypothetical protein